MDIISHLLVLGINYQRAPVAVREQLSFSNSELKEALNHLLSLDGIEGAVILSTCNRSEIYVSARSHHFNFELLKQFLADFRKIELKDFSPYFYCLKNRDMVEHLFRVSSGLESQVLGENEILGQIKRAYLETKEFNATDVTIEQVFEKAIRVGKKVRKETRINQGSTSLSSMAIKLAEREFNLEGKTILLVGVNKINEQIARYLNERNIQTVIVANRTYEKAVRIARYLGGRAIHFDQFKKELHKVDIVISSTAAPHLVLKKEELKKSLKQRDRELLLIDMAVPRDIDPGIKDLNGVTLYGLDDFNQVIRENLDKKEEEALKAEHLINHAVKKINFLVKPHTSPYQSISEFL
ncbi:MAG: glutamyl-tRNA reductase [Deltaproteobacteria bacterium]|nr:glutamyl-tRNA reductase [Deltaproteobacteria bacterium]